MDYKNISAVSTGNRGNPRFPLTPSRPFGKELSLTIYSNENFYDFLIEKSWVSGGTCWVPSTTRSVVRGTKTASPVPPKIYLF
jgi:hypothetical protein